MKVQNPHDRFFKELFSIRDNALDFINGAFPFEISNRIIPESLTLDPNSYTNEKLNEYFSDIIYTCTIRGGEEIKISLLFEHKSYPVKHIHFQLLRYMLNIWESNIKQKLDPQIVIPMIIYHGKSGWEKRDMSDYFSIDDNLLLRFVPNFDYLLTDLSSYTDSQIKDGTFKRAAIEIGLLMEKNIFHEKKLVTHLKDILNIGRLYNKEEEGLKFLESVLRYLFSTTEITVDTALGCIELTDGRAREALMTTADKLIERGTLLDKKEVLINQISRKFGISEDERSLIMGIEDKSKLDLSLDEILFAESKDMLMDIFR